MHSCISLLFLFFRTGISERNDIYFQLRQERNFHKKKPLFQESLLMMYRQFYNLFLYRKAGQIVFPCLQNFLLPLAPFVSFADTLAKAKHLTHFYSVALLLEKWFACFPTSGDSLRLIFFPFLLTHFYSVAPLKNNRQAVNPLYKKV